MVGTVFYTLVAIDPDVSSRDALEFAGVNITAVDKDGNEVENSDQFKEYFTITRSGNVLVNKKLNRNLFAVSFMINIISKFKLTFSIIYCQVIRINVLVTDSTAPTVQQGMGLLIIQIIDVNEVAPVSSQCYRLNVVFLYNVPDSQYIRRNHCHIHILVDALYDGKNLSIYF